VAFLAYCLQVTLKAKLRTLASGTTPRLLVREHDARMVGYGSMLLESFVAIMAMVAAACLPPGQFFAINSKQTLEWISSQGFPVTAAEMAPGR